MKKLNYCLKFRASQRFVVVRGETGYGSTVTMARRTKWASLEEVCQFASRVGFNLNAAVCISNDGQIHDVLSVYRNSKRPFDVDEQNDEIRKRVEQEIPTPVGGFETEDARDAHRAKQDARFLELVHNPSNVE